MASLNENCQRDLAIETPEECEIAHTKFNYPQNKYKGKIKNSHLPAGCYCKTFVDEKNNLISCTETKFNELHVNSGNIDEQENSAGICRKRGWKY